jgi:translation initiation factor 1
MGKKKNKKGGIVYSTNEHFAYQHDEPAEEVTFPPEQQDLRVMLDKKARKGKQVTLVTGFVGTQRDLKDLGRFLKSKCGAGGSAKDGDIIVQGDFRDKIMKVLQQEGYRAKKSGG